MLAAANILSLDTGLNELFLFLTLVVKGSIADNVCKP